MMCFSCNVGLAVADLSDTMVRRNSILEVLLGEFYKCRGVGCCYKVLRGFR